MTKTAVLAVLAAMVLVASHVQAQTREPPVPSDKALKLSDIIAKVEQRGQFRYISNVEWNTDGYYDVTYYTTDNAKVEIKIDAISGEHRR